MRRWLARLDERWQAYLRSCREYRLHELEDRLGRYTMYGSGPYGTSSEQMRDQQIELAHLRQQLGLPQETNAWVAPVLRSYGIEV